MIKLGPNEAKANRNDIKRIDKKRCYPVFILATVRCSGLIGWTAFVF
ncbi:MAG: hypothetical protein HWD61_10335 [Parachlamydiaceae bacterium]|nr:MAG: hypothetical protein HWD61_10335 [Parachlamydiaceae bacterium]